MKRLFVDCWKLWKFECEKTRGRREEGGLLWMEDCWILWRGSRFLFSFLTDQFPWEVSFIVNLMKLNRIYCIALNLSLV